MVNEARLTLGLLPALPSCSPEQKDSDNTNQTSESHNRSRAKTQRQRFGFLQPFQFGSA
jgi:hypothetical protein